MLDRSRKPFSWRERDTAIWQISSAVCDLSALHLDREVA